MGDRRNEKEETVILTCKIAELLFLVFGIIKSIEFIN
jgi:hypothetical protein